MQQQSPTTSASSTEVNSSTKLYKIEIPWVNLKTVKIAIRRKDIPISNNISPIKRDLVTSEDLIVHTTGCRISDIFSRIADNITENKFPNSSDQTKYEFFKNYKREMPSFPLPDDDETEKPKTPEKTKNNPSTSSLSGSSDKPSSSYYKNTTSPRSHKKRKRQSRSLSPRRHYFQSERNYKMKSYSRHAFTSREHSRSRSKSPYYKQSASEVRYIKKCSETPSNNSSSKKRFRENKNLRSPNSSHYNSPQSSVQRRSRFPPNSNEMFLPIIKTEPNTEISEFGYWNAVYTPFFY